MNKLLKRMLAVRPLIPLSFLGLGIYRAWIELMFVGSFVPFSQLFISQRDLFDAVFVLTLMVFAIFAKSFSPLYKKTGITIVATLLMIVSSILGLVSVFVPQYAVSLSFPSAALGGVGIAICILLWSEIYSSLNSFKIALYYSVSIVFSALLIYVLKGFYLPWLSVAILLLPVLTLLMAYKSIEAIPSRDLPSERFQSFSIPWKLVLVMALYAFAYGLFEHNLYSGPFGPHSAPGALCFALFVVVLVLKRNTKFDLNVIYRLVMPLTIAALFLLTTLNLNGLILGNFAISAAYTGFSILTMILIASLCFKYGASAIWLFGIERAVRSIFMYAGRQLSQVLGSLELTSLPNNMSEILIFLILLISIGVASFIIITEKEIFGTWGADILESTASESAASRYISAQTFKQISAEASLTPRETEVLSYIPEGLTNAEIASELYIAEGTVKAHITHIYQKVGVKNREELSDYISKKASNL